VADFVAELVREIAEAGTISGWSAGERRSNPESKVRALRIGRPGDTFSGLPNQAPLSKQADLFSIHIRLILQRGVGHPPSHPKNSLKKFSHAFWGQIAGDFRKSRREFGSTRVFVPQPSEASIPPKRGGKMDKTMV
jgi:hypothetical protein